jgi:hypothetical protein
MTVSSPASLQAPLLIAAAGVITTLASGIGMVSARGSTAVPAAGWAMAAGIAATIFAATGGVTAADESAAAVGRLVVASLAVCPAMSLLGAKRPQHAVWQIIVGSLACVLALPAATIPLMRPGAVVDVHLVSRCFLALLALAGWINFLGTRKAPAATLVTIGLIVFLRPFLPGVDTAAALGMPWADALAAVAVAAGSIAALASSRRRPTATPATATIDGPFLALRETLGAAWALRIAERFDRTAEERGWPCRLSLAGLDLGGESDDASWQDGARNCFESIARRFVSREWLARHGGRGA